MLSPYICIASSLVGAKTKTIGPSPLLTVGCAFIWTIPGKRNAKVFPDPVDAIPIKSYPESKIGNAFFNIYIVSTLCLNWSRLWEIALLNCFHYIVREVCVVPFYERIWNIYIVFDHYFFFCSIVINFFLVAFRLALFIKYFLEWL